LAFSRDFWVLAAVEEERLVVLEEEHLVLGAIVAGGEAEEDEVEALDVCVFW
jgi:hypothetical protein